MPRIPRQILLTASLAALVFTAAASQAEEELRTWSDASGSFSTQAVFVEFKDGKVHLQRADGKVLAIPSGRLSKEDQLYVRELLAGRRDDPRPAASAAGQGDWPQWRGAASDAKASPAEKVPLRWSESENILWKSPIPGRGHASPTIVGERIFLATADEKEKVQSVIGLDRSTGKQLWKRDLFRGGFDPNCHAKNSQASSTVACDGERIYAVFLNDEKIHVTALDLGGEQVWQTTAGGFGSRFGYSASPVLYKSLVIIAADNWESGYLAALDRESGDVVWRQERPTKPSYASPVVLSVSGRDQLLIAGCDLVASYDPLTGRPLWSVEGTTESVVSSVVSDGERVFATGGYPGRETIAVLGDGSRSVAWRNRDKAYVPSMLAHDGYLYAVSDEGVASCFSAESGEKKWQGRLGGNFSASPVLAGGHLYVPSEEGVTVVFKADPRGLEKVAENRLGNETFATPVICGGRIYLRVAGRGTGGRQEHLFCIGAE